MSNNDVNKRIYESLVKRDSKEKNVTVCRLVQVNDSLMKMVSTLKMELDELGNKLETSRAKEKLYARRIEELETILREKDLILLKFREDG